MNQEPQTCPICGQFATNERWTRFSLVTIYTCRLCGSFALEGIFSCAVREKQGVTGHNQVAACLTERHIHLGAGAVDPPLLVVPRNNEPKGFPSAVAVWEDLVAHFPRTVADRLDRALLNMAKMSPTPGYEIPYDDTLVRAAFAENDSAADFALEQLGLEGWTKQTPTGEFVVTARGWNRVAELERERGRTGTRQAFIAASFAEDMAFAIKNGLMKGVEQAGYAPLAINRKEFTGKICDEIIAEIRRSRFVVADFTHHRQSVYFEAGFALGLGLTVIWTCKKDQIDDAHFDTRQYNHIAWETAEDLARQLANRIRAVIPEG